MVLSELSIKSQGGTPLVWGSRGECGQIFQAEEAPCTTAWALQNHDMFGKQQQLREKSLA